MPEDAVERHARLKAERDAAHAKAQEELRAAQASVTERQLSEQRLRIEKLCALLAQHGHPGATRYQYGTMEYGRRWFQRTKFLLEGHVTGWIADPGEFRESRGGSHTDEVARRLSLVTTDGYTCLFAPMDRSSFESPPPRPTLRPLYAGAGAVRADDDLSYEARIRAAAAAEDFLAQLIVSTTWRTNGVAVPTQGDQAGSRVSADSHLTSSGRADRYSGSQVSDGGHVDPIAEHTIEQVGSAVLEEAVDEAMGRSNKKWALVLLAFVVGGIIGVVIVKRRRGRPSTEPELQ